jgi:DNA-binding FadR family transcriptional regulator
LDFPSFPRRNLHDQIVHVLGQQIANGEFDHGEAFPSEEHLCADLQVSRTALREALKVLSAKGLIETRPRRGVIVRPQENWNLLDPDVLSWIHGNHPDGNYMHKLVEVRRIVEPEAAKLAAQRATDSDLKALQKAFDAMKKGVENIDAFIVADMAAHAAIISASHNEFLKPVANSICTAMLSSLRVTNPSPIQNRKSLEMHEQINTAIQDRNPVEARKAMLVHQAFLTKTITRIYGKPNQQP